MPTYSIAGPDGKTYSIEGPEGATRDQIIGKIKERLGGQQPPTSTEFPSMANIPSEAMAAQKSALGGVVKNLLPTSFGGEREPSKEGVIQGLGKTGKGLLSAATAPFAGIYGGLESLGGHLMSRAEHGIGAIIAPDIAKRDVGEQMYQKAKHDVGTALMAVGGKGGLAKGSEAYKSLLELRKKADVDMENLATDASRDYKAIDNLGLEFKPEAWNRVADNIQNKMIAENVSRDNSSAQNAMFNKIDNLKTIFDEKTGEVKSAPDSYKISKLDNVRKSLRMIPVREDADFRALAITRRLIDEYMDTMKREDFSKLPVDPDKAVELFKRARGNTAALKRLEEIQQMKESAVQKTATSSTRTGVDVRLRKGIQWIMDAEHPERSKWATPEMKKQMNDIIEGKAVTNIGRLLSRLSLYHPLTGWGPAILAGAKHVPKLGMASVAIGHVAKKAAEDKVLRQIEALEQMIYKNSPRGVSEVIPSHPPVKSKTSPSELGIMAATPTTLLPQQQNQ